MGKDTHTKATTGGLRAGFTTFVMFWSS